MSTQPSSSMEEGDGELETSSVITNERREVEVIKTQGRVCWTNGPQLVSLGPTPSPATIKEVD